MREEKDTNRRPNRATQPPALIEHPLLRALDLDDYQPLAFWRRNWHWPWWDNDSFGKCIASARAAIDDAIRPSLDEESSAIGLSMVARAHPVWWACEAAAADCGLRLRISADALTTPTDTVDADEAVEAGSGAGAAVAEVLLQHETTGGDTSTSIVAERQARATAIDSTNFALQVDGAWVAPAAVLEQAERLPLCAVAPRERPAILMSDHHTSWLQRLAMGWGAQQQGCWLFSGRGVAWVEDLIWARPHAAFGTLPEFLALAERWKSRPRSLRRAMRRLELGVIEVSADGSQASAAQQIVSQLGSLSKTFGRSGCRWEVVRSVSA